MRTNPRHQCLLVLTASILSTGWAAGAVGLIDNFDSDTLNAAWNQRTVLNQSGSNPVIYNTTTTTDSLTFSYTGTGTGARQEVLLRSDVTLAVGESLQTTIRLTGSDTNSIFMGLAIDQNSVTPTNRSGLVSLFLAGNGQLIFQIGDGQAGATAADFINEKSDVYLRLTLATATTLQGSYSTDGTNFTSFHTPITISGITGVGYYNGNSRNTPGSLAIADNLQVVPEPSFAALLGVFGMAALARRRRN